MIAESSDDVEVVMQPAPDKKPKKIKKGAVLDKQVEPGLTLEDVEKKAEDFVMGGGNLRETGGYLTRGAGIYILFRESRDSLMDFAYKCPKCGKVEAGTADFESPYTLECAGCGELVFVQEKVKKSKPKK